MVNSLQLDPNIRMRLTSNMADPSRLEFAIAQFCERWQIAELYLFGSVLRDDFRPDSDIDVMVTFEPDARWGFKFVQIKRELEQLLGRDVDLLTKASIEESHNWIRRKEILGTARLVHAAE